MSGGQPNILLIMSDEHGAAFSGTYGHPFIATPAMDRLAVEGTTFDAAYCNNPLCVPSRLSFMTGRYTMNCEGWDNAKPLSIDTITWPYLLRRRGYTTALSGKMHLIGPDQLHGFHRQLASDLHAQLVHPVFPWEDGIPEATEPWPGVFEAGPRVPAQGRQAGVPTESSPEPAIPTGPGTTPEIIADDEATDRAITYLRDYAAGRGEPGTAASAGRPFALCVGLIAPHFPFVVPEPYFSRYYPEHADLPNLPPEHLADLPPAAERLRRAFGFWGHSDEQIGRARAAYYGLVTYLDDKIAQLLNTLDETGLTDRTIVIHTSDHGEMLGEHGLWRKMCFYEQTARVPLQIRWPGRADAGGRVARCVSLVDVTATIIDAADADDPAASLDGHSLAGLIAGDEVDWTDEAFCEHTAHGTDRPRAMLRRGTWKICLSGRDTAELETELYDLATDPGEFDNLAGQPSARAKQEELTHALLGRWDPAQIDERIRASQAERALLREATGSSMPPLF